MSDTDVKPTTAGGEDKTSSPEAEVVVHSKEEEVESEKAEPVTDPQAAAEAVEVEPNEVQPRVPSLELAGEEKSAQKLESREKESAMDEDRPDKPVISSEYQNFDAVDNSANKSPPPTYESAHVTGGGGGGEKVVVPSRYLTGGDKRLAEDLRVTANGGRRRTRRTTRRQPHYKIDADSDEGSNNSSIDEDYEVASILSSIEEGLTWRGRMQYALHNHLFHIIIVVLVCLDALIVMFELLLDVGAFNNRVCYGETPIEQSEFCHYDSEGECGPLAIQILEHRNITPSYGHGNAIGTGEENLCVCQFRTGRFVCDFASEPHGVNPALILHVFSLIILTIFLFEIITKIIAFRLKYFTHKFEVFDGIVVVVSWVLDVASIVEEEAFEAAALIIVLRLWRVVRIVNGAVLSSKAQSDKKLEDARTEARRIIHAFHKCQDKLDEVEEEKAKLLKRIEASEGGVVKRPRGTEDIHHVETAHL